MNRSFVITGLILAALSGSLTAMEAPLRRVQLTAEHRELLDQVYNKIHQIGLELQAYIKAKVPKQAGDLEQYNHLSPQALQEFGVLVLQLPKRFEGFQSESLKLIKTAIDFNKANNDNDKKLLNDLITRFEEANEAAVTVVEEAERKELPQWGTSQTLKEQPLSKKQELIITAEAPAKPSKDLEARIRQLEAEQAARKARYDQAYRTLFMEKETLNDQLNECNDLTDKLTIKNEDLEAEVELAQIQIKKLQNDLAANTVKLEDVPDRLQNILHLMEIAAKDRGLRRRQKLSPTKKP